MGGLIGTVTAEKNGLMSKYFVNQFAQIRNSSWSSTDTTIKKVAYMSMFISIPQSSSINNVSHAILFLSVSNDGTVFCSKIIGSVIGGISIWYDNDYIYLRRVYGQEKACGFINLSGHAIVLSDAELPADAVSVTIS